MTVLLITWRKWSRDKRRLMGPRRKQVENASSKKVNRLDTCNGSNCSSNESFIKKEQVFSVHRRWGLPVDMKKIRRTGALRSLGKIH